MPLKLAFKMQKIQMPALGIFNTDPWPTQGQEPIL